MAQSRKPWYRQTEVIDRACAYASAYVESLDVRDEARMSQLLSQMFDGLTRLVFESNTFEGAGLPERGTRAVLDEVGAHNALRIFERPVREIDNVVAVDPLSPAEREDVILRFRGRDRGSREVAQHYLAWREMKRRANTVKESGAIYLSAEDLREVHRLLSNGLLPEDAKVGPGEYRVDHRIAGRATGFVAPEPIPSAMQKLEDDIRTTAADYLRGTTRGTSPEVYEQAAGFSHRVTAIHPFPDFNGRLSRLVLSIWVERSGIPFPVSIKFDKKGRERYLYALRRGDKGDLRPMTVLVARAVVDGFEAIDAKLELAGLPRLLPPADA